MSDARDSILGDDDHDIEQIQKELKIKINTMSQRIGQLCATLEARRARVSFDLRFSEEEHESWTSASQRIPRKCLTVSRSPGPPEENSQCPAGAVLVCKEMIQSTGKGSGEICGKTFRQKSGVNCNRPKHHGPNCK